MGMAARPNAKEPPRRSFEGRNLGPAVRPRNALVLQQPWATAVCGGAFPSLVRSKPTSIRGWVAVLSTGTMDPNAVVDEPASFPLRCIVGGVEILDCIAINGNPFQALSALYGRSFLEAYPKHFLLPGRFLWVLSRTLALRQPLPFVGTVPRTWARVEIELHGRPFQILGKGKTRVPARLTTPTEPLSGDLAIAP